MLSTLVISYLFLGGTGAGALVVASLLDLFVVHERFGAHASVSFYGRATLQRIVAYGMLFGFLLLAFGIACLAADLGRIDRVASLFLHPTLSFLSVGSFLLALLVGMGAFLSLVRFMYVPFVGTAVVRVFDVASLVAGLGVMAYTGLLLQSLSSVAFWATPLVPILFVLSSSSCGIAVVLLVSYFLAPDARLTPTLKRLVRVDMALVLFEALFAILLVVRSFVAGGMAYVSLQQLLMGDLALWWWAAFVACGIIAPLVFEAWLAFHGGTVQRLTLVLAAVAALVLVGGFGMRFAIASAGTPPPLALEEAQCTAGNASGSGAAGGEVLDVVSPDGEHVLVSGWQAS